MREHARKPLQLSPKRNIISYYTIQQQRRYSSIYVKQRKATVNAWMYLQDKQPSHKRTLDLFHFYFSSRAGPARRRVANPVVPVSYTPPGKKRRFPAYID